MSDSGILKKWRAAWRRDDLRFFVVAAVLLVGPWLLFSSPDQRADWWGLGFLVLVSSAVVRRLGLFLRVEGGEGVGAEAKSLRYGGAVLFAGAGFAVVQVASLVGGRDDFFGAGLIAAKGMGAVAGVGVVISKLREPGLRRGAWRVVTGLLVLVLVSSLAGYLLQIENFIFGEKWPEYYDRFRMAAIWPTRWLLAWRGNVVWENAVYAGIYFGLGLGMVSEGLARAGLVRGARKRAEAKSLCYGGWWRWVLAGFLVAGIFLTDSRTAWLMAGVSLPLVLLGRPWRFAGKAGLVLGLGIALGLGLLHLKSHLSGVALRGHGDLLERGSAGRLDGYRAVWEELEGRRVFGQGIAATNKPVGELLHEHSSFLATFRGGGLVGLAGHLLILGAAGWVAAGLWWRGERRPLIFLAAVVASILFDRSNVFGLSGYPEFLTHWVAVLMPFVVRHAGK